MASSDGVPASVKREGTMQRTVREAVEGGFGCDNADHEQDVASNAPAAGLTIGKPLRQLTMEVTVQEGRQFLKDSFSAISEQADVPDEEKSLSENKQDDDAATDILGEIDQEEESSGQEADHENGREVDNECVQEVDSGNGHKVGNGTGRNEAPGTDESIAKATKQNTMVVTAKEGQELLENYMGGKPDPSSRTRAQQKSKRSEENPKDEPDVKKPRRTHTMMETTEEAQRLIPDSSQVGKTRAETAAVKKAVGTGNVAK